MKLKNTTMLASLVFGVFSSSVAMSAENTTFPFTTEQFINNQNEPRQPGGCKLKTAPVRPVVAARPAEYVCSEDLFY